MFDSCFASFSRVFCELVIQFDQKKIGFHFIGNLSMQLSLHVGGLFIGFMVP